MRSAITSGTQACTGHKAMSMKIDEYRIRQVTDVFRDLGIEGAKAFEDIDEQYHAVMKAAESCGIELTSMFFYVNALVSYKLKMKGEVFWRIYAETVSSKCRDLDDWEHIVEHVKSFTRMYNNLAYEYKVARLDRIRRCIGLKDYVLSRDYIKLARETAKCLKTLESSKTILFSVKMAYYVHRIADPSIVLPYELPIPVDIRVACITYTSGIIDINGDCREPYIKRIMQNFRKVQLIWNRIACEAGIPPLHIDAVLWYLGRFTYVDSIVDIMNYIDTRLYKKLSKDLVKKLITELLFYRPLRQ